MSYEYSDQSKQQPCHYGMWCGQPFLANEHNGMSKAVY